MDKVYEIDVTDLEIEDAVSLVEDIIVNTNHLITLECFYNHFKEAIFIKNLSMKKWILKIMEFNFLCLQNKRKR